MRWMMNTRMSKTGYTNSNVADGGIDVNENRRNTVAERTVAMIIRRRVAVEVPIRHGSRRTTQAIACHLNTACREPSNSVAFKE